MAWLSPDEKHSIYTEDILIGDREKNVPSLRRPDVHGFALDFGPIITFFRRNLGDPRIVWKNLFNRTATAERIYEPGHEVRHKVDSFPYIMKSKMYFPNMKRNENNKYNERKLLDNYMYE